MTTFPEKERTQFKTNHNIFFNKFSIKCARLRQSEVTLDLGKERTPFNSFDTAKFFKLDGYSLTQMGPHVFGAAQNFSDAKERKCRSCTVIQNSFIQWVLVEDG